MLQDTHHYTEDHDKNPVIYSLNLFSNLTFHGIPYKLLLNTQRSIVYYQK